MKIYAAPLQGYTDSAWRRAHAITFGPEGMPDAYFAPFLRVEKGSVRPRDLRELGDDPDLTVPQIIFKDLEEFEVLTSVLSGEGYRQIDLNLGCPFPPQCHKGRGAAMVARIDILGAVAERMAAMPDIRFSVKMRLGLDSPDEWRQSIAIIDAMPLTHITVHPRTGRQQYRGELYIDEFENLLGSVAKPVIFNGDIATAADISAIENRFPALHGVMTGRGLLASPWLIAQYRSGDTWPRELCINSLLEMHKSVYDNYARRLCGESQLLAKLLPFWEYPSVHLPAKTAKAIRKARSLAAYSEAVNSVSRL